MKKTLDWRMRLGMLLLCCIATGTAARAATAVGDTLFVCLKNLCVDAFPTAFIRQQQTDDDSLRITTKDGQTYAYALIKVSECTSQTPDYPKFTSFKFNNKFNDDVYADVQAEIRADGFIVATVASIGKRLTPSFQLSDSVARVYVNGVRQHSKRSRLRFENPVDYLVAHPGHRVLREVTSDDGQEGQDGHGEESEPDDDGKIVTPVALTASMLSTNAPSNYGENPANLLDGNLNTIFHSTWGTGAYEKLPADSCPYLEINLPDALHHLQFSYTNRETSGRHATSLRLYAGDDGKEWTVIRDFDVNADGLPTQSWGVYVSPVIDLKGSYTRLRFEQTACYYHNNYLAWAEFSLASVTYPAQPEPGSTDGQPEEQPEQTPSLEWKPLGRTYTVSIDWPQSRTVMVPRIDINTADGKMVSSKDYYLEAEISINGAGMFPDMPATPVQIKGRGNSSWSNYAYDKNPYRLKFSTKQKPFALTAGKNWVLLANKQYGSMTSNAVGMKTARLAGSAGANHIIPVELYMNGSYRGSYQFTEKIGFSNNSIDIVDETAATMLELDKYYDETYRFRSDIYSLPVNIKEPDLGDATATTLTLNDIQADFNRLMQAVSQGRDISPLCDVDALAAFYMTNELICNLELMHPKSTFLYKENIGDAESKFVFGPVWDFDWAFGYENSSTYFQTSATADYTTAKFMTSNSFWQDLMKCGEPLQKAYYRVWTRFMEQGLDELEEYCADYYAYAQPSLEHNATMWGDGRNYATATTNAMKWLRQRAQYIYATLTPYDISDEEEEVDDTWMPADDDDTTTSTDVAEQHAASRPEAGPTRFNVYDLRGRCLKTGVSFDTFRQGLTPGLYVVNGRKVLIP